GMFAFSVWDVKKEECFLARDRVGKKPLVYYHDGGLFIFGSEIKAVLEDKRVDRALNFRAISDFFTYGYVPSPKTVFSNIHKLPPAHTAHLSSGGLKIRRYWLPDYGAKIYLSDDSAYGERIAELLDEAVRMRLVSDVPLGLFLSGGIDSSAVLAFMSAHLKDPVKTFSIGFDDAAYNELAYASYTAHKYDTEHKEFVVKVDAAGVIPKLVWHYNEPFGDSSCIPTYYVSEMTRTGVTVALSGDGGDEAFGGYNRYIAFGYLMGGGRTGRALTRAALALAKTAGPLMGRKNNDYMARLGDAAASPGEMYRQYMRVIGIFPDADIFTPAFLDELRGYDSAEYFMDKFAGLTASDRREAAMDLDFTTYLPEDLMVKADIASMANSLEVRSPFLDHKMLEFVFRMPFEKKVGFFRTKVLLRAFLKKRGLIPDEILARRKQGFAVPVGEWFKGPLKDYYRDMMSGSAFIRAGFMDRASVDRMFEEHVSGRRDHTHRLWCVLNFELWYKIFVEGVSPDSLASGRRKCAG
ncbi:MAG: asparagine synthase (glutamine-hydrolyzing), partial [Candidatus Omnitrophota bacterium]